MSPAELAQRLRFDVERVRAASHRLEAIDRALSRLRTALLERGAAAHDPVAVAEARLSASLAERASLGHVFGLSGVALVAATALARWLGRLRELGGADGERLLGHVEAGRVGYHFLSTVERASGRAALPRGYARLVSAVVLAEVTSAPELDLAIARELADRRYEGEADPEIAEAASLALRAGAAFLGQVADRAEPALERILREAERIPVEAEKFRPAGRK